MTVDSLLGMTFMLFTGAQPNWAEMAQTLLPSSKDEILKEVIEADEVYMDGDSVKVLYDLDPQEYSYTNFYEFIQVLNKHTGDKHSTLTTSMVDKTVPMLNLDVSFNEKENSVFFTIPKYTPTDLWHPDGIVVDWHPLSPRSKIGIGDIIKSQKNIDFMNQFLEEPYVFNIRLRMKLHGLQTIGVLRDNKMTIYDIEGNQYDSIEDLIIKKYGSVAGYIAERKKPIIIDLDEAESKRLFGH